MRQWDPPLSTPTWILGLPSSERVQETKLFHFHRRADTLQRESAPPAAYRPEHGFLTTSILYDRMCHILHTCTLNSSSLSACDTPVGLGLNAAAWMNQGAAYFVSFDPRAPSLTWSCSLSWRAAAATTFFSGDRGGRTCCCKHMDENIVGIGLWIGGLRGQCFTHHYSTNSNLMARDCSSCL